VFIMKDTLWRNNRNFENDVLMIHVNFIMIVITVSGKQKIGITFPTAPHMSS
jgi:hypothetical protein